jgi:hypothetical protein
MSGAGRIKGDGSDADFMYEIKDASKAYTMSGSYLEKLRLEAIHDLKQPCMIIYFTEADITARITLTKGKRLI